MGETAPQRGGAADFRFAGVPTHTATTDGNPGRVSSKLRDMNTAKRKMAGKSSEKRSSKTAKGRKSSPKSRQKGNASSDEEEDEFVSRRSKKPRTGRVGRTVGKQYPPEIRRALGRANALYVDGKIAEASNELQQVVVQCSSIPEPYALLGLIYQDSGKYAESLMFYKLACTRDPRNLLNHREAARIALILADHTSRLEALKVLTRLQPNDLNLAIERARCLLELEKPKQALDVYAKAAKRFPRRLDIYLDLAEGVESISPQQHIFVHQALASCLRRTMGKKYLGPDVRDLADGFAARLRELKLEGPKPKRLPPRTPGLPSKRMCEVAMKATDLLVMKLMESRKRQEPQYEAAVQVVEGLVSWLDSCRSMADGSGSRGGEEEEEEEEAEELDSDSDVRDCNDEGSDDGEDESESDGEGSSGEEDQHRNDEEEDDGVPMDVFTVDTTTWLRYGICQLYCGEKHKASRIFAVLDNENPEGPHGDMMLEIAKVYAETDHVAESIVLLRQVAQSMHPRHCLAGVQLGATYAAQGKHQLAADAYTAVLVDRPHHAAALAGLAEAAYWRGGGAARTALELLTPAIERATRTWADDVAALDREDDDEGECATGFQRVQLLIQWATLSRIDQNVADFACVALPLVSVAVGQMAQLQEFERAQAAAVHATNSRVAGSSSSTGSDKPGMQADTELAGQAAEGGAQGGRDAVSGEGSSNRAQPPAWKPSLVSLPQHKRDWQSGDGAKVSALTLLLLENLDVVTHVGRRAIFWYAIELVRCLHELGSSEEVSALVSSALKMTGFLRPVEREDLQAAASNDEMAVLRSIPGGSPIHGPATRDGLLSGPGLYGNVPSEAVKDPTTATASSEQYHAPPWRCVEDKDDDGMPRRAGRAWRLTGRSPGTGPRRSRSRALMEIAEHKNDGDAVCALVRALSRTPGNDAMWNLLQRVAMERGVETADGGFHGEQVEALVGRHREQAQGLIYRGHDAALWNRSKQALRLYGQVHLMRPEEPLPALCLATQMLRMVTLMESMVELDGVCVLQALACLHRYADARRDRDDTLGATSDSSGSPGQAIPEAMLEQEVMYNLGRGYHQVGLTDLAMEYYNRALRVEDERGHELRSWHGDDGVTKEAAHNLCTLYQKSGATAMALSVLNKYLTIG